MELLNEVYLLSKFDISSFSMSGDIDFQANHFANFEGLKLTVVLLTLGRSKLTLIVYYYFLFLIHLCFNKTEIKHPLGSYL